MPFNNLLKLNLVDWFDHEVAKPALYGYIVVFLCVIGRAATVNWLLCAVLACINHGTQLFNKIYTIEIRHTVVD